MDRGTFINYIPNSQHNVTIDDRRRWDCDGKPAAHHVDKCSIQEPLVRLYNMGVFLDVFSYWTTNNTLEFITEGHHHILKKEDYFPLRKCTFMGFDAWCPNNPDILLRMLYGNGYKIPVKQCKNGHWI
ncbi:hypothetical protein AC249_AIPGENE371 [Exaiptasia diaphana]|nr:hypothetical protein AC249_AIPGENE371 [Exaiptasia diaphana]